MVTFDSTPTRKVLSNEIAEVQAYFNYGGNLRKFCSLILLCQVKYNMIPLGPERPVGPSLAVLLWINCPCSCLHHAR